MYCNWLGSQVWYAPVTVWQQVKVCRKSMPEIHFAYSWCCWDDEQPRNKQMKLLGQIWELHSMSCSALVILHWPGDILYYVWGINCKGIVWRWRGIDLFGICLKSMNYYAIQISPLLSEMADRFVLMIDSGCFFVVVVFLFLFFCNTYLLFQFPFFLITSVKPALSD